MLINLWLINEQELGFIPCKDEQSLQSMELKKRKKIKANRKSL